MKKIKNPNIIVGEYDKKDVSIKPTVKKFSSLKDFKEAFDTAISLIHKSKDLSKIAVGAIAGGDIQRNGKYGSEFYGSVNWMFLSPREPTDQGEVPMFCFMTDILKGPNREKTKEIEARLDEIVVSIRKEGHIVEVEDWVVVMFYHYPQLPYSLVKKLSKTIDLQTGEPK